MRISRGYTVRNKYKIVGHLLRNAQGSLLDIGARDRRLATELNQLRLKYYSADLSEGYDYQLDLEQKLDLPDGMFDYIVALDVLEHIEHIHQAFYELARITRRCLIIGLPNIAVLTQRWSFLMSGHLGTKKYDLLPEPQGDHHRWLTIYPQINTFIEINAPRAGLDLEQVVEEMEGGRLTRILGYLATRSGLLPAGWFTGRCIYVLTRR